MSLGEVEVENGDVYGTGVNLAARLESIAVPGGVCISDWVYALVHSLPGTVCDSLRRCVETGAAPRLG